MQEGLAPSEGLSPWLANGCALLAAPSCRCTWCLFLQWYQSEWIGIPPSQPHFHLIASLAILSKNSNMLGVLGVEISTSEFWGHGQFSPWLMSSPFYRWGKRRPRQTSHQILAILILPKYLRKMMFDSVSYFQSHRIYFKPMLKFDYNRTFPIYGGYWLLNYLG